MDLNLSCAYFLAYLMTWFTQIKNRNKNQKAELRDYIKYERCGLSVFT